MCGIRNQQFWNRPVPYQHRPAISMCKWQDAATEQSNVYAKVELYSFGCSFLSAGGTYEKGTSFLHLHAITGWKTLGYRCPLRHILPDTLPETSPKRLRLANFKRCLIGWVGLGDQNYFPRDTNKQNYQISGPVCFRVYFLCCLTCTGDDCFLHSVGLHL